MIVFTKGVARENQGGAVRGLGQSASEKSLSQNILSFYSSFHMGFFINFYHFLFIFFTVIFQHFMSSTKPTNSMF